MTNTITKNQLEYSLLKDILERCRGFPELETKYKKELKKSKERIRSNLSYNK